MIDISHDKQIKISYAALGILLVVLFGFAGWMTSVDFTVRSQADTLNGVQEREKEDQELLRSIDRRLQRIEVILEETFKKKGD